MATMGAPTSARNYGSAYANTGGIGGKQVASQPQKKINGMSYSDYFAQLYGRQPSQNDLAQFTQVVDNVLGAAKGGGSVNLFSSLEPYFGKTKTQQSKQQAITDQQNTLKQEQDNLISEYKKALDEANAANEARYNEIKGRKTARDKEIRDMYKKRYEDAMALLEGAGEQEALDIAKYWKGQTAQGMQDLVSRGLMNTTVAPTLKMGYGSAEQADLAKLNQAIRQQHLDVGSSLKGEEIEALTRSGESLDDFIASKEDTGPNQQLMLQLAETYGSSGAAVPAQSGEVVNYGTTKPSTGGSQLPATPADTGPKMTLNKVDSYGRGVPTSPTSSGSAPNYTPGVGNASNNQPMTYYNSSQPIGALTNSTNYKKTGRLI